MQTVHRQAGGFFVETVGHFAHPIVRCAGEIDIAAVPLLEAVAVTLENSHVAAVEIDLSEVTFIDATGIAPLLDLRKKCQSRHIDLQIVTSPAVDKVLELIGDQSPA